MALAVNYILLFLNVQTHLYGACAWGKDGLPAIYDFVTRLRVNSENMLEYLGKIQGIFCPEQPICYEQDKRNSNDIPPYLMIGNTTMYVDNISTYRGLCCLPCSCSDNCLEDDNCCLTNSLAFNTGIEHNDAFDTEPINETDGKSTDSEESIEPTNETDGEALVKSECIGASFWNYFKRLKYISTIARYSMVARCFIDKSNRSLVSKCEAPTTSNFEETTPVTSNTTGRIYWNKFCALCNNDSKDLVTWNSTVISDALLFYVNQSVNTGSSRLGQLDNLKTFDDVHETVVNSGNLIFTPPSNMAHKRCFVKSTLFSCEQNSGDIIYAACKQFYSPVYFTAQSTLRMFAYMNIFCFLCRENSLPIVQKNRCALQESSKSAPGAVTSLLDYTATAEKFSVSHDHAQYSHTKNCRCDEFLDPYQGFCRQMLCPPGELLITCQCVQPIKRISGMPVLLKLKVTVDQGNHLLSADVLINRLHVAVTKFLQNIASHITVEIAATLRPMTNETEYYLCLAIVTVNFGHDTKETLKPFLRYLDSQRYEAIKAKKVTFNVLLTQRILVWIDIVSRRGIFRGIDLQEHYDLEHVYLNKVVMAGPTRRGAYQIFSPLLYCTQVQLYGNESLEQNGILTINATLPNWSVWDYHRVSPQEVRICIDEYIQVTSRAMPILKLQLLVLLVVCANLYCFLTDSLTCENCKYGF